MLLICFHKIQHATLSPSLPGFQWHAVKKPAHVCRRINSSCDMLLRRRSRSIRQRAIILLSSSTQNLHIDLSTLTPCALPTTSINENPVNSMKSFVYFGSLQSSDGYLLSFRHHRCVCICVKKKQSIGISSLLDMQMCWRIISKHK